MIPYKNYKVIEDSNGKKALFKNKNKENKSLVVFVHGFTGNYLSTWGILPELLTRDPRLAHFDFLFWGYSSNFIIPKQDFIQDSIRQLFTQFLSKHKTNQHIDVVAQGLQTELKYLDEYDNITLVGHSLGGLVIRSYIIQNLKERKPESMERINKIDQIILFGTPNEGLDIANNKLLSGLNNQVYDMGSYNEFINTLREEWVELVFKNKEIAFTSLMVAGEDDYFVPFEQVTKYFRDSRELTKGDHLSMVKPDTIHDTSYKIIANNLLRITHQNIFELRTTVRSNISKQTATQANELVEKIVKLIAERGLDDISWNQTLPAQYFLIRIARLLKLNKNTDFLNLLDVFLKNFYMGVDNKIMVLGEKGFEKPEELTEIRASMIEEDKNDSYFSRFSKNVAENIDIELLSENYYYALMAQIAYSYEFPESLTLKLIQDLAIRNLLYGRGKKPTNDHGGWYPQRLPWLTARILIGLKNSGYESRDDREVIEETVSNAVAYLLRSINEDTHWRSGIGDYVTDWETTALCMEALDQWGKINGNEAKIREIITYILDNQSKWLKSPSFSTKQNSTNTLSAVTLLCNTIVIIDKYFSKQFKPDYESYMEYLSQVLDRIIESSEVQAKQYSTIHQISFYIARMAVNFDQSLTEKFKGTKAKSISTNQTATLPTQK